MLSVDASLGQITLDFNNPDQAPEAGDTLTVDYSFVTLVAGTVTEAAGAGFVSGSHYYADDGSFIVTICVDDDNLGSACDSLTVTVFNERPVVEGVATQEVRAAVDLVTISTTFDDPGILDTHTATILWGDEETGDAPSDMGLTETPGVEGGAATTGTIVATHTYATRGDYELLRQWVLHGVRLHDCRHTMARLYLEQGISPKTVAERLGHSSVVITLDTYSHLLPGMQEAAAAQFDAVMESAKSGLTIEKVSR